jgi:hypothetical protein
MTRFLTPEGASSSRAGAIPGLVWPGWITTSIGSRACASAFAGSQTPKEGTAPRADEIRGTACLRCLHKGRFTLLAHAGGRPLRSAAARPPWRVAERRRLGL